MPVRKGEEHYLWKGDGAVAHTKRQRARTAYPLDGVTCEHESCESAASDRHHVDGDTGNNERENIRLLCRRHHMAEDGRLEALRKMVPLVKPPEPCVNCGKPYKPRRHGMCASCADYQRRNGVARPPERWAS